MLWYSWGQHEGHYENQTPFQYMVPCIYALHSRSKEWKESPLVIGNTLFAEHLKMIKLRKSHLLFIFRIKVNNDSEKILLPIGQSPTTPPFEHYCPYELKNTTCPMHLRYLLCRRISIPPLFSTFENINVEVIGTNEGRCSL
ncbi:hypothetical protein HJG60_009723 [Phyllostomus discolor]|uniref:Uncharacterized protein n=1 Tax=Phyllostomus discolor TaxID=89673 RepID=A0A834B8D4_9CHIR|nr:hypothetical protein HJG60_009723 [Phyllostomus discolor]